MNRSESIAALAAALAKAQGKIEGALKEKVNGGFKTKYADLQSVWDAIREPLSSNGLAIVQGFSPVSDGVLIETTLMHASGEWMESQLLMPVVKKDPQGVGSAITYGRRYALMAIAGVAPEDDDGEAAMGRTHQPTTTQQQAPPPPPKPQQTAPAKPTAITPSQLQQIGINSTRLFGDDNDGLRAWINNLVKREVASRKDLTFDEAALVLKTMNGTKEIKKEATVAAA